MLPNNYSYSLYNPLMGKFKRIRLLGFISLAGVLLASCSAGGGSSESKSNTVSSLPEETSSSSSSSPSSISEIPSSSINSVLEEALSLLKVDIPSKDKIYLEDVSKESVVFSDYNAELFAPNFELYSNLTDKVLSVKYWLSEKSSQEVSSQLTKNFSGFLPTFNADKITLIKSHRVLSLDEGESFGVSFYLDKAPSSDYVISFLLDDPFIKLDKELITFTRINFSVKQFLKITALLDSSYEDRSSRLSISINGESTQSLPLDITNTEVPERFSIITSVSSLSLNEGEKATISVSLSHYNSLPATIEFFYGKDLVSINPATLTFSTPNVPLTFEVEALHNVNDFDTYKSSISLFCLLADQVKIPLVVNDIDQVIPEELIISEEVLKIKSGESVSFSLTTKDKPKESFEATIVANNSYCTVEPSSLRFDDSNWDIPQEVVITCRLANSEIDNTQSTHITISYQGLTKTVFVYLIKTTGLQQAIISPFAYGFATKPVEYFTAYYDVGFEISYLEADFGLTGKYVTIKNDGLNSFTNNACMLKVPDEFVGKQPHISLRANYAERSQKVAATPTYELVGNRIKVSGGDHVEYFNPSSTVPTMVFSPSKIDEMTSFKKFTRVNAGGEKEYFYLAMRPESTSVFVDNGLSPTNFEKVFCLSQETGKENYTPLYTYYGMENSRVDMSFVDTTPKDAAGYETWRKALTESVASFNSSMGSEGINASIKEVAFGESTNFISQGSVPNNNSGICRYFSSTHSFDITVNSSSLVISTYNNLVSTLTHEMGHLLGFSDSPYASSDSLFSYSRDRNFVTYFQPNDIATLRSWIARGVN